MDNVLLHMIGPVVSLASVAISRMFRPPERENPTLSQIRAHQDAERAQRAAEHAAKEARDVLEQIKRQADRDREHALARQEEANRTAARAIEETKKMKAQMEEAANAARRAQELAEVAANAAMEEAARLAQEAEEERERARKIRNDAERAIATARDEIERARKAADDQRREAEAGRALARTAAEEVKKANVAKEEAERRLKEGIQPVVTPSREQFAAAKRRIQYREDCFHFAVAGVSGSGKSSLVNAFRGLRGRDPGAAAVGVTEMTLQMTRYPDPNPDNPFVWYDIPGAGTLKCRDWQYFNDQGLYVFDCIIVLFDNRFTMTDVAILANARRFNIPTYIVRSKADQHIRNIVLEMEYDSERDDDGDVERSNGVYKAAQKKFVEETRKSVQTNLEDANLPNQRVYIVSNSTLLSLVRNKMPKKTMDEVDLVSDLLNQAYARRGAHFDEILKDSF